MKQGGNGEAKGLEKDRLNESHKYTIDSIIRTFKTFKCFLTL